MRRKLDQREQLAAIVESLARQHPSLVYAHKQVSELLEHAQNAPPHGAADGSIAPELYGLARALEQTLGRYEIALARIARNR